jgi:phosphatidate cytidylyltransferase
MLYTRILTAAVALAVLVGFAWLVPPIGFDLLLLLIVVVAGFEWVRLLGVSVLAAITVSVIFAGAGVAVFFGSPAVGLAAKGQGADLLPLYGLVTLLWLLAVPMALKRFVPMGYSRPAGMLFAFILLLTTWLALIQADGLGKKFLLSVLLLVWVADTAAYFAGRLFGRRKLAPAISPGKTWEGVAGAVIANLGLAVAAVIIGPSVDLADNIFVLMQQALGWGLTFMLVVLLTMVSVVGDLYESMLKRIAGVKDSGVILPGHGGVLDRIDALIAVLPVAMLVVSLIQSGALA